MKKKMPTFRSERAAAAFVDTADLSQYDLGGAQMVRFETKPKDKSINLRLPEKLYEAVRAPTAPVCFTSDSSAWRWNALSVRQGRAMSRRLIKVP